MSLLYLDVTKRDYITINDDQIIIYAEKRTKPQWLDRWEDKVRIFIKADKAIPVRIIKGQREKMMILMKRAFVFNNHT